jgi:hypothetical protein
MSLADTDPDLERTQPLEVPRKDRPFVGRSLGLTDRGRVRPANEDHFVTLELA